MFVEELTVNFTVAALVSIVAVPTIPPTVKAVMFLAELNIGDRVTYKSNK